jgi:hypothetical protein
MKNTLINTPLMKKTALSLAILVSFCLMFAVSCGSNTQAPSGALPSWKVGDTWTERMSDNGSEYMLYSTVTGEQELNGINCYVVNTSFTPAWQGEFMMTQWIDKTTVDIIEWKQYGYEDDLAFVGTCDTSYQYYGKKYPLSVGNTWIVTTNVTTSVYTWGHNVCCTRDIEYYTYKVQDIENVTVPAGTFECFKIVTYNSTNYITGITWLTDMTRSCRVKVIGINGAHEELMSYSLSK